jgi:hypothetical protein
MSVRVYIAAASCHCSWSLRSRHTQHSASDATLHKPLLHRCSQASGNRVPSLRLAALADRSQRRSSPSSPCADSAAHRSAAISSVARALTRPFLVLGYLHAVVLCVPQEIQSVLALVSLYSQAFLPGPSLRAAVRMLAARRTPAVANKQTNNTLTNQLLCATVSGAEQPRLSQRYALVPRLLCESSPTSAVGVEWPKPVHTCVYVCEQHDCSQKNHAPHLSSLLKLRLM